MEQPEAAKTGLQAAVRTLVVAMPAMEGSVPRGAVEKKTAAVMRGAEAATVAEKVKENTSAEMVEVEVAEAEARTEGRAEGVARAEGSAEGVAASVERGLGEQVATKGVGAMVEKAAVVVEVTVAAVQVVLAWVTVVTAVFAAGAQVAAA